MILNFLFGLDTTTSIFLVLCILAVCVFEFINGFHDTANAVATVIYTKTLKPQVAVVWSGIWNFIGVFMGVGVAMKIIKLLPLEAMASVPFVECMAMVIAILLSAILWNIGTWYVGIPCSSSHTLIGSLLGGSFAFAWMNQEANAVLPWKEATKIGQALFLSPAVGFSAAIILMLLLRWLVKNKTIFKSPEDSNAKPPMWIRGILVATCTGVSFAHGSNDGQKGVGLMMVIMMGFAPMYFAVDNTMNYAEVSANVITIGNTLKNEAGIEGHDAIKYNADADKVLKYGAHVDSLYNAGGASRVKLRVAIAKVQKLVKDDYLTAGANPVSEEGKKTLKASLAKVTGSIEYVPMWVKVMIAICLGIGTMIGWKRIVVTIGEKIGKSHLTYAQGASAELVAATTIYLATSYSLPVSTTHVLSSGVAGTMVASGGTKNLQRSTVTNIAIAWLLTLPVTFVVSGLLYMLLRLVF